MESLLINNNNNNCLLIRTCLNLLQLSHNNAFKFFTNLHNMVSFLTSIGNTLNIFTILIKKYFFTKSIRNLGILHKIPFLFDSQT